MNGAIDTAPTHQSLISRIDNTLDRQMGNIAGDDLNTRVHYFSSHPPAWRTIIPFAGHKVNGAVDPPRWPNALVWAIAIQAFFARVPLGWVYA